jgi:DNA-binding PucR family transcriptional regulator
MCTAKTVRYRLGRLSELFGSALQDPDQRARLMLVLAWDPAAEPGTGGPTVT